MLPLRTTTTYAYNQHYEYGCGNGKGMAYYKAVRAMDWFLATGLAYIYAIHQGLTGDSLPVNSMRDFHMISAEVTTRPGC